MNSCPLDITPPAAVALALGYYLDDSGWFSAVFAAILCHELGHWIAIRLLGGRVTALRVELAGLCMESTAFTDKSGEVAALAAGPVTGLLWGVVAGQLGSWGEKSSIAALALNLYNLLPALPLDGGRILLALTGSTALLRCTGLFTVFSLLCAAVLLRKWLLLLPAAVLATHLFKT